MLYRWDVERFFCTLAPGLSMRRFFNLLLAAAIVPLPLIRAYAATPISVVAAENFYGDVAAQIGGSDVAVRSILSNPDEDPHLFEVSPSVAREISAAGIVVYSGIDYDPWMQKLLKAAQNANRKVIVVADLIGKKVGDNPHIWYDLAAMEAFAGKFAQEVAQIDPAHAAEYRSRLAKFERSLQPIKAKIASLRARLAGTSATATEPVFGYMLAALGIKSLDQRFQLAVMNNTEPSASDVAAFETNLKKRRVRFLVYNSQASDPIADRMKKLAKESNIPIVAATETEPKGKSYQAWMLSELDAVENAVAK
jgi:zinc/manganese transport system substrate-binding protein